MSATHSHGRELTRASVRNWQAEIRGRKGVRLELPLRRLLELPESVTCFSLEALPFALSEGFSVAQMRIDAPENSSATWMPGARYEMRCRDALIFGQVFQCPERGEDMLHVQALRLLKKGQDLFAGVGRIVTPIVFSPILTLHFTPWTEMPEGCSVADQILMSGACCARNQEWGAGEDGTLFLRSWHYQIELMPLGARRGEEMQFLVRSARYLEHPAQPSSTADATSVFLHSSCFRIERNLPLVVSPELLISPILKRFETSQIDKSKTGKSAKNGKLRKRYLPFRTSDFARAVCLRRPANSEIAGLEAQLSNQDIGPTLARNGIVMLDYPSSNFQFAIAAMPCVSPRTDRPFLSVLRIAKPAIAHASDTEEPASIKLSKGMLRTVCGLCLNLPQSTVDRVWKGEGEPPNREDILADLAKGYRLVPFADHREGMSRVKLYSQEFFLVVRPESYTPCEPKPGMELRTATQISHNAGNLQKKVGAPFWPFENKEHFSPQDLVFSSQSERVDHILNSHYLFASTYSQLLTYRDAGLSNGNNTEEWATLSELLGFQDQSGRHFDNLPKRIKQELSSEKARLLVRIKAPPQAGVLIDGVPVEILSIDGRTLRGTIEVVSGRFLLVRLERKSRDRDSEMLPSQFACPFDIGDDVILRRYPPRETVNLKRQIDDLRKGRFLAASQEIFAQIATAPNKLRGQFEPASKIEDQLARIASRKRESQPLNKEQKRAVSHAARTPHAYFIKGPPGTGKTQVISDLIELLAARGERILLASAQNKPLAEAISRVASAYGVVAARVTNARRSDLNDAERATVWDNLVDALGEGLRAGGVPDAELSNSERVLRARWRTLTGMQDADEKSSDALIAELIDGCLADVNLYAININAIASRLQSRDNRSTRPRPDFQTPFDTLIIDEASRVNDAEFVTAALRCRRWVLVGDERQLPPFVNEDDSSYFHALSALFIFEHELDRASTRASFSSEPTSRPKGYLSENAEYSGMLRAAVEKVENLWLSERERQPFTKEKVYDLAEALFDQRALSRLPDGSLPTRELNYALEGERPLRVKLRQLANALAPELTMPEVPDAHADYIAWKEFEANQNRYLEGQLQNLQEAFSIFIMRSFFERGYGADKHEEADDLAQSNGFRTTLVDQYRMRPTIAALVSADIYDNQYLTPADKDGESLTRPLALKTFPSDVHFVDLSLLGPLANCTPMGAGWGNAAEAEHVIEIVRSICEEMPPDESASILILSAYKKQIKIIEERMAEAFLLSEDKPHPPELTDLKMSSIDGAQGSEADIVIISFVRVANEGLPNPKLAIFLQDLRRLNVAITRARRKVIFVGHATTIENFCGENGAAGFLASLLSPEKSVHRSLPYRLSEARLLEAKEKLDDMATFGQLEDMEEQVARHTKVENPDE